MPVLQDTQNTKKLTTEAKWQKSSTQNTKQKHQNRQESTKSWKTRGQLPSLQCHQSKNNLATEAKWQKTSIRREKTPNISTKTDKNQPEFENKENQRVNCCRSLIIHVFKFWIIFACFGVFFRRFCMFVGISRTQARVRLAMRIFFLRRLCY